MSTVTHRCYQKVTVAMGQVVMSPMSVATKGHNSDGLFGDIIEEAL
jgi:hypothetical protein